MGSKFMSFGQVVTLSDEIDEGGSREMGGSTRLTRILKVLAVAGFALNGFVLIVLLVFGLGWQKLGHVSVWTGIWATFSIGMPLYGLLYVSLKMREYLRDINIAVSK